MNVVRKVVGIFQVWRYLKADRKKKTLKLNFMKCIVNGIFVNQCQISPYSQVVEGI